MTRDLMALLAEARPTDLDPTPDAARRDRDLRNALESRPESRRRAAHPKRRLTIGIGIVAAGAAASVTVATVGHGTRAPSTPGTPQTGGVTLSARQVLLAAAEAAAKEPMGRYWRVHSIAGWVYRVDGAGAGGYQVYDAFESDRWISREAKEDSADYERHLPSGPLTSADRAAWRKAGSPARWRVTQGGGSPTLTREGTGWRADTTTPAQHAAMAAAMDQMCRNARTTHARDAEKKCVRTQQAKSTWMTTSTFADFKRSIDVLGGGTRPELASAFHFLTQNAVSPGDRATTFRLLAGLPGVRSVGEVTDARGRTGIGLATRDSALDGSGTVIDYQVVLDPRTHHILGDQQVVVTAAGGDRGMPPGTRLMYDLVLDDGWTNDAPHHA